MKKIIEWAAKQKYYFDNGVSLLNILTFGLMVLVNKDTLTRFTGFNTYLMMIISIILAFGGMWFAGWLMSVLNFKKTQMEMAGRDHPYLIKILNKLEKIENEIQNK